MKKPVRSTLKFEPAVSSADQGTGQVWAAADHKFAFTITREHDGYVAHACRLDGSKRCRIGHRSNFKTFDAAVRLCSRYTASSAARSPIMRPGMR
jgi:hypothetical protein